MIDTIILALIQAATEFLPVSSSGHLLAAQEVFGLESSLTIDVALHFGTLLAIMLFFKERIIAVCTNPKENKKLILNVFITSIPAALAGFLFSDILTEDTRVLPVVIAMLSIIGLLMIFSDRIFGDKPKTQKVSAISQKDAASIGMAQALALIPGTSRSGITILAARARGLSNSVAAEYSFLAGIPVIAGAALKTALEPEAQEVFKQDTLQIIVGIFVSFVVGYAVLNFLITYISKNGIAIFGYYRLALATILFILWLN